MVVARGEGAPGALTFNAEPPEDYAGKLLILAAIRLGDHAHIDVYTGRMVPRKPGQSMEACVRRGHAGELVMQWHFWEWVRDALATETNPAVFIREVEFPTVAQLEANVG